MRTLDCTTAAHFGTTRHFEDRAFERGLPRDAEDFILAWGEELEAPHGATYLTVVRRELPGDVRWSPIAKRAEGWVLVVGSSGAILTCYRLRDAFKTLRRRRDRNSSAHFGRKAH